MSHANVLGEMGQQGNTGLQTPSYWALGDHIVLRHVRQGKTWGVLPVIVVRDSHDLSALYLPSETQVKFPRMLDGGPLRLLDKKDAWLPNDLGWSQTGR
jgi:hypothetical protein